MYVIAEATRHLGSDFPPGASRRGTGPVKLSASAKLTRELALLSFPIGRGATSENEHLE